MKLTKLQRYTAYCIMLAETETHELFGNGFCHLINNLFGLTDYDLPIDIPGDVWSIKRVTELFPELYAKKPIELWRGMWFETTADGWKKRIILLKQYIKETSPD